jgi:MmyB-like transcription regulator ligand binding domain
VRFHNTGVKQLHHPVVGELSLTYNRLDLPADHGLTIFTCVIARTAGLRVARVEVRARSGRGGSHSG